MKKENYIFGTRAVIEAIRSDKGVDKVLIKKGLRNELTHELLGLVREFQIPMQYVPIQKLDQITRKNHQGTVAFLSEIKYYNIEEILPQTYEKGQPPLILLLDGVTDVRNFGAIARTAECAGVHAIVIPAKGAAAINADAVKTSAGALHVIPVCRVMSLTKSLQFLKESGLQSVAATEKANQTYYKTDFSVPTVIIMGSEENGISKELLAMADNWVKIPIFGEIQSLNVSVAASVLIYEAVKQRTKH